MNALIEHQDTQPKGPSLIITAAMLGAITLLSGGAGFAVSATMLKPVTLGATASSEPKMEAMPEHGASKGEEEAPHAEAKEFIVYDIPSITTNLMDPSEIWIRMELSLVFSGEVDEAMAAAVHQDIIAYVRTVKLYNLQGGSGYQHLISDLQDRAAIRTDGVVRKVLVRTLIFE